MRIGFPGTGTAGRHLRPEVAGPEHEIPPEPDMMDQDTAELAYRRGAGIEVTLLWHRTTGELTVSVTDAASGASFELPVAADEALAAFHHPYAYAAAQGGRVAPAHCCAGAPSEPRRAAFTAPGSSRPIRLDRLDRHPSLATALGPFTAEAASNLPSGTDAHRRRRAGPPDHVSTLSGPGIRPYPASCPGRPAEGQP